MPDDKIAGTGETNSRTGVCAVVVWEVELIGPSELDTTGRRDSLSPNHRHMVWPRTTIDGNWRAKKGEKVREPACCHYQTLSKHPFEQQAKKTCELCFMGQSWNLY